MKVSIGQFEFDTDEMSAFPTGVAGMPMIFVNENGAAFLQTIRRSWLAPKIRYIGRAEALRLAAFYHIAGLAERLHHTNPHGAPEAQPAEAALAEC